MKEQIKRVLRPFARLCFKLKRKISKKARLVGHYHPKIQKKMIPKPVFLGTGEDGGFAVDISNINSGGVLYSFGVGKDISFDLAMRKAFPNMEIHLFDPTPISIQWLKKQILPENMYFHEIGLSDYDGTEEMYIPTDEDSISGSVYYRDSLNKKPTSVQMRRMKSLINEMGHDHVDIIKMDIEGSEFKVISDILVSCISFDQLCVEVHNRFFEDGDSKLKEMITMLNDNNYVITWVSEFEDVLLFEKGNYI